MKWTVTMYTEKYIDCDEMMVQLEKNEKTFECPFECCQVVYYAYPEHRLFRRDKWVIRKSRITGIWATNIYGVILGNNEYIHEDLFDRLFINKEEAIEFCLKKNQQTKVKIYND